MEINNSYVPSLEIFESAFGNNTDKVNGTSDSSSTSFSDVLTNALNSVNDKQVAAENASDAYVRGDEDTDIASVMLASSEAKIFLQLAVQVRNKLLSAYDEIMKMSL